MSGTNGLGIKGAIASLIAAGACLRRWSAKWPNANVGGPTGPLLGIALDIDPRHVGDQSWQSATGKYRTQ